MSRHLLTPGEIQQWGPRRLRDFIGCEVAKQTLVGHLRVDGDGPNILISGETGTGKTSLVETYTRTLVCPHSTDPLDGPCGVCPDCQSFDFENSDSGIFAHVREKVLLRGGPPRYFYHVNCVGFDQSGLRNLRSEVDGNGKYRSTIYLDEAQYLADNKMDAALLKPVTELNAIWIATGVNAERLLHPMLVRRFATRCSTSPPLEEELALFLADRCLEWGIQPDDPETIALLAKRSRRITAECINVLARAAGEDGRCLTRALVSEHPFITGVVRQQ